MKKKKKSGICDFWAFPPCLSKKGVIARNLYSQKRDFIECCLGSFHCIVTNEPGIKKEPRLLISCNFLLQKWYPPLQPILHRHLHDKIVKVGYCFFVSTQWLRRREQAFHKNQFFLAKIAAIATRRPYMKKTITQYTIIPPKKPTPFLPINNRFFCPLALAEKLILQF